MRTFTNYFTKVCLAVLCVAILGKSARATVYTAVLSGNFNSTSTWGGIAPGLLVSTDVVIIPIGIAVTLTTPVTFSGTSSLTVDGTLTSSTSASPLILTSGTLSGTGIISVDSVVLGLTSGITYTGSIVATSLTSTGATISSNAAITVTSLLNLPSGSLSLSAGSLTMSAGSMISLSGGTIATSGTGSVNLSSRYDVMYSLASATSGLELSGAGLDNITVNVPGAVTLSANQTVNGTLTLTSGALALNGYTLTFGSAGNLATGGAGTITGSATSNLVVNTTGGLTGLLTFTSGSNIINNLTVNSGTGTTNLGSNLTVNGTATLTSGALGLWGYTLTLGTAANVAAGGSGTLTGSATSSLAINTMSSLSNTLNFTSGANILDNLTVNLGSGSTANLGGNLTLDGMLTMTNGALGINGNTVTLGATANIAAGGTGTLTGSATSNLIINATGSLTGTLNFTGGADVLNNVTMNMGTAGDNATLGSNLTVNGTLNLINGMIVLGANNLSIATGGALMGGNTNSYVATNGAGTLMMNLAAGATDSFQIGTMTNYAPMVLTANSGSASSDVNLHVVNGVYSNGYSGTLLSSTEQMVNATWYVSGTDTTGINYTMTAMWNAGMGVNSFNPAAAYISHYTSGAWDSYPLSAAVMAGGMYSMSRSGITSLSPFMVTNVQPSGVQNVVAMNSAISVYPNPAINTLNFTAGASVESISLYDISGRFIKSANAGNGYVNVEELPAGTYFIHFLGQNLDATQQFVKE